MMNRQVIPLAVEKRPGLSRVDVAVVVFVVGLLAAVSVPLVVQFRESSRLINCQHNLQQLGVRRPL